MRKTHRYAARTINEYSQRLPSLDKTNNNKYCNAYGIVSVQHRVKAVTASRAFHVAAPIWKNLSDFVKVADSFNFFKRHLKCHLFDATF